MTAVHDREVVATIGTSGAGDTAGLLRDSDGGVIATAESGGSRDNFSMTESLRPGVYYLHVVATDKAAYGVQYSVPEPASAAGPPARDVRNLLGAWFGNYRYGPGDWSGFPDFFVLDRVVSLGSGSIAVEHEFDADAFLNDPDRSFVIGLVPADGGAPGPFDYVTIERAFDIFCASYIFSLGGPNLDADDTLFLFGDVDEDTLECEFGDASVYQAVVVRPLEPGSELLARAAGRTRAAAEARHRAMLAAKPVGYRADILAAVRAASARAGARRSGPGRD